MLCVPKQLTAGISIDWIASHSQYDSEQWNLLINIAGPILIPTTSTAQQDGSWLVEIDGKDFEDVQGEFYWSARVINVDSGQSRSISAGNLTVVPDLGQVDEPYDGRSPAKRIHDGLLQAIQDMASGKILTYSIEGRSATYRSLEELNNAEAYWRRRVQEEEGRAYRIIRSRFA